MIKETDIETINNLILEIKRLKILIKELEDTRVKYLTFEGDRYFWRHSKISIGNPNFKDEPELAAKLINIAKEFYRQKLLEYEKQYKEFFKGTV